MALEKCDDGNVGASSKQPAEAYERQQFVLDDHSCASATEDMTFAKSSCSHSLDYDDSGTLSATPVRSKKVPITTLSLVQQILQQQEEKQQAARKIARSTLTHGLQPPNATNHCAI